MRDVGNKRQAAGDRELASQAGEHAEAVLAVWHGRLGRTVRCVPDRQTLVVPTDRGTLFAKLYRRRAYRAVREWRWLHLLGLLGVAAPRPVACVRARGRGLVVFERVPGRSLDAWIVDAARAGTLPQVWSYAIEVLAPFVRGLHSRGLVHRDLNCPHLFVQDLAGEAPPSLIDVERMFRPSWRARRWIVKELASLWCSSPVPPPLTVAVRFLRVYAPDSSRSWRARLLRAVVRKAARLRRHRPRFG